MKDKKIFDVSLWKEGLLQLKMMGIMYLLVTIAVAVLFPLGLQQSAAEYQDIERIGFLALTFFVLVLAFVGVPLMALYLFRFLTSRDGSDFYHSVPHTRTCLYISFASAVMTWFLALLAVYLIVSVGLVGMFPNVALRSTNIPVVFCSYLAAAVLMLGLSMVSMSLTGTTLTNLAVFAMIALLPRLVITVSYYAIVEHMDFVIASDMNGLLDPSLNLLFGCLYSVFDGSVTDPFYSWASVLYSGILGVLYFVGGGFLFQKRKSEKAGQTAIHPILSLVFRLMPAFMVCLVPLIVILERLAYDSLPEIIANNWFELLVFYVIAVLVYLMYELITTKKLSAMVKSLPGLIILFIMNILYGGIFQISVNQMYQYQPEAEELDYIQLGNQEYWSSYQDYFERISADVEFKNERMLEIACEALEETRTIWKEDRSEYNRKAYGDTRYTTLQVTFCQNGIERGREVIISDEKLDEMNRLLSEDINFKEANTTMPSWKYYAWAEITGGYNLDIDVQEEDMHALYEALKLDIQDMDYSEWYHMTSINTDLEVRFHFELPEYPDCTLYICIPVNNSVPTFYQAFMERYGDRENTGDFLNIVDWMEMLEETEGYEWNLNVCLMEEGFVKGGMDLYIYEDYNNEIKDKYGLENVDLTGFAEELKAIQETDEDGTYILAMRGYRWNYENGEDEHYSSLRLISKETFEKLMPYMQWVNE